MGSLHKLWLSLIVGIFAVSCTNMTTHSIANNPFSNIPGNRVHILIHDENGNLINSALAAILADEGYRFLATKGFQSVKSKADADLIVILSPGNRNRSVDVPAQTYAVPIYTPPQTSTANFFTSQGTFVSGTVTSPATTTWSTGYRGGYTAMVEDQWILVLGFTQVHGKRPVRIFEGQIWRSNLNYDLLNNESNLRASVRQILQASKAGTLIAAPLPIDNRQPGCWYTIGIQIDREKAGREIYEILEVSPDSPAEKAGLKRGDIIRTIAGIPYKETNFYPEKLDDAYRLGRVEIKIYRGEKAVSLSAMPVLRCNS